MKQQSVRCAVNDNTHSAEAMCKLQFKGIIRNMFDNMLIAGYAEEILAIAEDEFIRAKEILKLMNGTGDA